VTRIHRVLAVPATGAGYYEDLAALQASHVPLPQRFTAPPVTPGFRAVREPAEAVSVGLLLDDGRVAWGDCVAVSYSSKAGRDSVFRSQDGLAAIQHTVAPALTGRVLTGFRELAAEVDALRSRPDPVPIDTSFPVPEPGAEDTTGPQPEPEPEVQDPSRRALLTALPRALQGPDRPDTPPPMPSTQREGTAVQRPLHTAVRYGVSQALLQAVALVRGLTMAEVICQEWDLPVPDTPVPIHAQSGSERYYNAEKMMVRRIVSLPHALVDDIQGQLGTEGSEMTRYIRWLAKRIGELGGDAYRPTIHLDVHGALGQIYQHNLGRILGQLYAWEQAAQPYPLRIESPMVLESREEQIEAMAELRGYIRFRKMNVQLVADEWANTLDDILAFVDVGAADMIQIKMPDLGGLHHTIAAVLACHTGGAGAFLGGSYAETDLSARASVHVALATRPDLIMAKPGMGVDEAISLVENEMARTLASISARAAAGMDLDDPTP
jgi:methylaspartate ammonia-lyase